MEHTARLGSTVTACRFDEWWVSGIMRKEARLSVHSYTEIQLDGLREVMNTGAGHAAADLGEMFDRGFEIDVPRTIVMPIDDAVKHVGKPDKELTSVAVRLGNGLSASLIVLVDDVAATVLCESLGVAWPSEMGQSLMYESGNLLACAYANAIAEMIGSSLDVHPPVVMNDMLSVIVHEAATDLGANVDELVLVESNLHVRDSELAAQVELLLIPDEQGIGHIVTCLGLGS